MQEFHVAMVHRRDMVRIQQESPRRWRLASIALLAGTFVSVINSNIVNVPLRDIAADLHVSISAAALLVTTYGLAFGSLMPLGGWLGNRFGRRRIYCVGVSGIALGALASIGAPNLPTLVVLRVLQGASSAMVTPLVIAILSTLYAAEDRPRALSGWAAANGLGQALGPPLGGILASLFTWRAVFVPGPVIAGLACIAALRFVPADGPNDAVPLDWRGALSLTAGAFLLLSAFAAMPQLGIGSPAVAILGGAGVVFLACFGLATQRARHPFVSRSLAREPSFRSAALGVTAGTFSLGTAALGVPLYLTRDLHASTLAAGFIALAFPLALVLSAPFVARRIRRTSSRAGLRTGLGAAIVGGIAVGAVMQTHAPIAALVLATAVLGVGLAFVHTGAAVSSTSTAVGRYGAGVGLFNTIRVAGSTLGAAWVGLALRDATAGFAEIFYVSAAVAAIGLLATTLIGERAVAVPAAESSAPS